ncbi:MAG: PIG-L deacetylase family protein [Longimicrobiales bacterium]|nr:PIG-L deacetylase family protein [Longimicrobiales bacterium]
MMELSLAGLGRPPRLLFLGAHSDDIEIGCGATAMGLMERFPECEVRWVVFSGQEVREGEARHAARQILGDGIRAQVEVLNFRDGFFPAQWAEVKARFEDLKGAFEPDLVFSHRGDDRHQDHRMVSELTWNTFRDHLILEYEIPKYDGDLGQPNVFVPVSEHHRRQKVELLMAAFGSQRPKTWFSESTFEGLMRIRGVECASPTGYAEGFYARKVTLGL